MEIKRKVDIKLKQKSNSQWDHKAIDLFKWFCFGMFLSASSGFLQPKSQFSISSHGLTGMCVQVKSHCRSSLAIHQAPRAFCPTWPSLAAGACFCVPVLSEVPFCFSKLCLPSVVSCPVHSQNVSKAWEGWGEWGCSHSGNFLQFCSSVTSQRVLIKTGVF